MSVVPGGELATSEGESRKRALALHVLCAGVLIVVMDTTNVTMALASIAADLHIPAGLLSWVLNAYLLPFAGLLLLSGRLSDLWERRRLFMAGIGTFALAALACSLARNPTMLLAARAVQGMSGAVVVAVALSLIVNLFTAPDERARAVALYGFVRAAASGIGVLLGGLLTDVLSWHWIFLLDVPIGFAVLVLSGLLLPQEELSATFSRLNARIREPLIPIALFRQGRFSAAIVIGMLWAAGTYSWFVISALYLQKSWHYTPFQQALAFLPANAAMALFSIALSARVVRRFGVHRPLWIGLALVALAPALFALTPTNSHYLIDILPGMVLQGLGSGMAATPLLLAAMRDIPSQESGLASGLVNTSMIAGGALGLAFVPASGWPLLTSGALIAAAAAISAVLLRDSETRTSLPSGRAARPS